MGLPVSAVGLVVSPQAVFILLHPVYGRHPAPPCSLERTELTARKKSPHFFHTALPPACHMQLLSTSSHFMSFFGHVLQ